MSGKNPPRAIEVQPLSGFNQALTYSVPAKFAGQLLPGCLVAIPLGPRRTMGIVSSLKPTDVIPAGKLKPISALVRREPVLSPDLLELARWMSGYYACSLEPVLEG